jgi:hypothetical protein
VPRLRIYHHTTLTVDKINQTTDLIGKFTNKFDKYFAHPVYKVGSYLTNFGSRYNNALQYCQSTCDKQKWQIDLYRYENGY